MTLAQPYALWLLLLLPPLALAVRAGERRRVARWVALGQEGRPVRERGLVWLGAAAFLVLALGQPRWGRLPGPPLPPGHDVVLLLDVSRSMGARDALPDRLGLAVESAVSLVTALGREPGSRAAVVVFAGQGRERCPLTGNLGAVIDVLRSLRAGEVRPGGTNLAAALQAAAAVFDAAEHAEGRTVVFFSDGEDHAGAWLEAANRLRASGVIVHTVAIGDAERGEEVPSGRGNGPLLYDGAPVVSRRNDAPLEAVAKETGGAFLKLGLAQADLGRLYLSAIAPVARRQREAWRAPELVERYAWFLLAALALAGVGSWPRVTLRGTSRWAAGFGVLLAAGAGAGPAGRSAVDAIAAGRAHYAAGRWAQALAEFERATALDRTSAVALFDAAATLFQLERYGDAYARYGAARVLAGPALRTKIDYALGNTALALGDVAGALRHYDDCLASTGRGASLEQVRRDARVNRRFAARLPRPPQPKPEDDESQSRQARERNEPRQGESTAQGPSPGGGNAAPEDADGSSERSPRPQGGGGGSGETNAPGTPEERLQAALDQIRAESERRRLPEEPPPGSEEIGKDW